VLFDRNFVICFTGRRARNGVRSCVLLRVRLGRHIVIIVIVIIIITVLTL